MQSSKKIRSLVQGALIAALYVILTYVMATVNMAYGQVQFRVSEALTVLPFFTPVAIPGLTLGCFLANLASPLGVVDWIFGSLATLLAALATRTLGKTGWKGAPFLAPLPPVIVNMAVVGLEIACLSDAGFSWVNFSWAAFGAGALSVGLGELVVCYGLGLPLLFALKKTGIPDKIFA